MKQIMTILCMLAVSAVAGASEFGLNYLASGNQNQTPYQKLETLFNQSGPMSLDLIPKHTEATFAKWRCVIVDANDTLESLAVSTKVPTQLKAKIVVDAGVPDVPAKGPLFPAVPGKPEKDAVLDIVGWIDNSIPFTMSPEAIGRRVTEATIQLTTTPELFETSFESDHHYYKETFRKNQGMIVVRTEFQNDKNVFETYAYSYCFQQ